MFHVFSLSLSLSVLSVLFMSLSMATSPPMVQEEWVVRLDRDNSEFHSRETVPPIIVNRLHWMRCRSQDQGDSWECVSNLRYTHGLAVVNTSVDCGRSGQRCITVFSLAPAPIDTGAGVPVALCETVQGILNLVIGMGNVFTDLHPINWCRQPQCDHTYTPARGVWVKKSTRPVTAWDFLAQFGLAVVLSMGFCCVVAIGEWLARPMIQSQARPAHDKKPKAAVATRSATKRAKRANGENAL